MLQGPDRCSSTDEAAATNRPRPWIALPDLSPDDPATQGAPDAYVTLTFFPFWAELSAHEKADYLDRWDASAEWRAVISERYDHEGLDFGSRSPRGRSVARRPSGVPICEVLVAVLETPTEGG